MASGSGISSHAYLPFANILPFYEKALPDVSPLYGNPMLSASTDTPDMYNMGVDSAGNYDETCQFQLFEDMDLLNTSGDDISSLTTAVDNFIQQCRSETDNDGQVVKTSAEEQVEANSSEKENEGVDDCGHLQPPGTNSTPADQKPPLSGLDNAPRRPFTHLPRFYQRPRTLFEQQTNKKQAKKSFKNNACQTSDWEIHHHIGSEKYLTVSKFKGRKSVHIRQWYMDKTNKSRPTQKGLVLTPEEWNSLTQHAETVNNILQQRS